MITAGPLRRLAPAEFDERLSDDAVTVVNVHVPYDGEFAGTDAFVEFDQIVGDPAISADRAAPILLYCRSGRMSRIAGEALIAAGYQGCRRPRRRDGCLGGHRTTHRSRSA